MRRQQQPQQLHPGFWYAATFLCFLAISACTTAAGSAAGIGNRKLQQRKTLERLVVQEPRAEFEKCVTFLHEYMQPKDREEISEHYIRENVRLALQARSDHQWAEDVPPDLFLNDVLPYASLNEPRDEWRRMFYTLFKPIVANATSLTEAAQLLNQNIWAIWGIHFQSDQTPEIMSPSQVIKAGYASCTGLSIFLVNACRAVGIPARVSGTPSWMENMRDDLYADGHGMFRNGAERFNNHNWVEIWDNGWHFTGAAEFSEAGFNRTWFFPQPAKKQVPGSVMHAIYSASFKPTHRALFFPLAWDLKYKDVPALDVTQYYLDAEVH